ncbi:MAG: glutamate--tRNA ligase [Candidatus Bathyarchaeia archaeon]
MPRSQSKKQTEILEVIRKIAFANAIGHDGIAQAKPVLGKLLAEKPELRSKVADLTSMIDSVVKDVNALTLNEQIRIVKNLWPDLLLKEKGKVEERRGLPPLPNAEKYEKVVTRFAPNPDAVLHIGSARAVILSYEYARMYNGSFVLRFEDTDPRLKKASLKFYDLIKEDLKWLGCDWDEEYIQSDHIETYYEYAELLLKRGYAYVCTCSREEFHEKVTAGKPCPCRNLSSDENMVRWQSMLNGGYGEGEAVVRIKTNLSHPNPAIREWPAFRIIDPKKYPHPRVGKRYRVWPLFAFANGIDDHLNGVTHVIRGKEHLTNQKRQEYLYDYLGWKYPEAIHYGRLKIVGATLSKSKIVRGVQDGTYTGWDDPKLATFRALRRRGIQPEAIRQLILDIGPRPVDITLSWDNLYAYNRKMVDPKADRLFFVKEPLHLVVRGLQKSFEARIPLHPANSERGCRTFAVEPEMGEAHLFVSSSDKALFVKGAVIRLMELFNVQVQEVVENEVFSVFTSESYDEARRLKAPLVHWLPKDKGVECKVLMPDGSMVSGLVETTIRNVSVGQIVQFERFGFVCVDRKNGGVIVVYAHR